MKNCILVCLGIAMMLLLEGCATAPQESAKLPADDSRAYLEVLRSDFNAGKVRALNQAMKLTVAEADKFWPVYRSYEKDMAAVGDRKLALLREFMSLRKAGALSDANSAALAKAWLQNAQDRLDLWKEYHRKISEAVSPVRAAQFLQVENQMAIFVDLTIASEMPEITAADRP